MPQEHNILRCFSCETFQVHTVKKIKKWECKICGAKQSIQKIYGKGSGRDCRQHVMKLNELRMNIEKVDHNQEKVLQNLYEEDVNEKNFVQKNKNKKVVSKWTEYIDEEELSTSDSSSDCGSKIDNKCNDFLKEEVRSKRLKTEEKPNINIFDNDILNSNFQIIEDFKTETSKFDPSSIKMENNQVKQDKDFLSYLFTDNISKSKESESGKSLNEDEVKNKHLEESVNKNKNIFCSDPNDLDDIANINF